MVVGNGLKEKFTLIQKVCLRGMCIMKKLCVESPRCALLVTFVTVTFIGISYVCCTSEYTGYKAYRVNVLFCVGVVDSE